MTTYYIDESYAKHGLLTSDGNLTPLGEAYGVELINDIRDIQSNSFLYISMDWYTKVEDVPNDVISSDGKLTAKGVEWLLGYMERHIVNRYTYYMITHPDEKLKQANPVQDMLPIPA